MKRSFLFFVLALAGCNRVQPGISAEDYAAVIAENPGLTEQCKSELRRTGYFGVENDNCFRLLPPERWTGIWNSGWEWSNFCPAPATDCSFSFRGREMDLSFAKGAGAGVSGREGTFAITFVGRRSMKAGHYGHMGRYRHLIVVEKVEAIHKLDDAKD